MTAFQKRAAEFYTAFKALEDAVDILGDPEVDDWWAGLDWQSIAELTHGVQRWFNVR